MNGVDAETQEYERLLKDPPCYRCGHNHPAHFEDGVLEAPTGCAVVIGPYACSCQGYVEMADVEA